MVNNGPLVSVIIVHYNNVDYLHNCVRSIAGSTYKKLELIVVDNGSRKISLSDMPETGLRMNYIPSPKNMGYGDGCNQGIKEAKGEFVFLLNNDIEIETDCIAELVNISMKDRSIAVVQPKMLDLRDKGHFHSSGAGGMIDIFGYPFAKGRIFETVEEDSGQYDNFSEVFWASGAAVFIRKNIFDRAGYFDTYYFMYMEEIDLIWRIHLLGAERVVFVPAAKIFHLGCPNLGRDNLRRMYYVHRNSLMMLLTNYSLSTLLITLPVRVILEMGIAAGHLLLFDVKRTFSVFMAFGYILGHIPFIARKRMQVQAKRKVSDRYIVSKMYRGSIVLKYLLGHKKASRLSIH